MEDDQKPARGRARGRQRLLPAAPPEGTGYEGQLAQVQIGDSQGPRPSAQGALSDHRFTEDEQKRRWESWRRARDYMNTCPSHITKKHVDVKDKGTEIPLAANFFPVRLRGMEEWRLYQYSVDFEPDQDSKRICKALMKKIENFAPVGYVFDGGHMLFSTLKLPVNPTITTAVYTTRENIDVPHVITLKNVKSILWNDADMIHFYNIVTRMTLEKLDLTLLGRYYYDHKLMTNLPKFKLSIWPGYKTVLRPYEDTLMMNVEMVSKVIRTDNILQMMNTIRNDPRAPSGLNLRERINTMFAGTVVMTGFNHKTYKVSEVDWNKNVRSTFKTKDGSEITFLDYYKNKYGIVIKDINQPLLVSPPGKRDFHRGDVKDKLLVPELCVLTGLTDEMRSNINLMRELKSHLIIDPDKRVNQLQSFMKRIVDNSVIQEALANQWGIQYPSHEMTTFSGRIIQPERLIFGNNQDFFDTHSPSDWTNAFRSRKLFCAVPCSKWAVLVPSKEQGHIDNMITNLQKVGTPLGYAISRPQKKILTGINVDAYKKAIDEVISENKGDINMIFIVLLSPQANIYSEVKKRCAVQYGVSSQCCLAKNVEKANMSVCTKLAVQMCAKQGGEPWSMNNPLAKANVMVFGYDVYHSGGPADKKTMVGAMVANLNATMTRYTSVVQMKQKTELSQSMGDDFKVLLKRFREHNLLLPSRILFYRDGVGEGQLSQVVELEVADIEAMMTSYYQEVGQPLPKFSFIVVSKRINARFFQINEKKEGNVPYSNPPPGIVVDHVVTLPERYDFYLVSQVARQGTVSPTSYNVIRDHPSLTPSQMQAFSFKLCHMYYNWSGTVSVPAVCQYAHKLAYLTGMSLMSPAHINLANLLFFL